MSGSSNPYVRPTLTTLRAMAAQDIATSGLPGVDGLLQKSVLRVLSWVMAGFAWLHYDYLDWIYQQSNPWSATGASAIGWGALVKVTIKPAGTAGTNGLGVVAFAALPGRQILAGARVLRGDGFAYTTTAQGETGSDGNITVPVLASAPDVIGNAAAGTSMRLASPIAGVTSSGSLIGALTDGSAQEDLDAFKSRYLAAFAAPPQGGDVADYIEWATAISNVTRAWAAPSGAGIGTVVVFTMFDVTEAAHAGFPQGSNGVAAAETRDVPATGDQLTVANAIYPVRPATALVYSCAPTPQPINFAIANLSPATPAMKAAIAAALSDMFLTLGRVGGCVDPATMAQYGPIYPSDWNEAVDAVAGLSHCNIAYPSTPIYAAHGCLPVLGAISWPQPG